MKLRRTLPLLVVLLLVSTACQPGSVVIPGYSEGLQAHALDRLGYGPDPWSRAQMAATGIGPYIDMQLEPDVIDDSAFQAMLAPYPLVGMDYAEVRAAYDGRTREVRGDLARVRMLRAIHSRRQLEAVLIDFWVDHFNVYAAGGGDTRAGIVHHEHRAIAPHVLGRFEDMLIGVAQSPAMLDYLDNDRNSRWGINENYARELLELHTVGVDGGYTLQDIQELARLLTGWTTTNDAAESTTGFIYRDNWHDSGPKTFLGSTWPGNEGIQEGLDALQILARHPKTAERVSHKLAVRFVGEDPPAELVAEMAGIYMSTNGDLLEVMRYLLYTDDFFSRAAFGTKVKRPFHFAASIARALKIHDPAAIDPFVGDVASLGEPLYQARLPTGYPDVSALWAGNGMLLRRFEQAYATAQQWRGFSFTLDESGTPEEITDALIARIFVRPVSAHTRVAAVDHVLTLPAWAQRDIPAEESLAVLLSSPEFLTH
jgi:uncharacterized protein (DUF1800 family)